MDAVWQGIVWRLVVTFLAIALCCVLCVWLALRPEITGWTYVAMATWPFNVGFALGLMWRY